MLAKYVTKGVYGHDAIPRSVMTSRLRASDSIRIVTVFSETSGSFVRSGALKLLMSVISSSLSALKSLNEGLQSSTNIRYPSKSESIERCVRYGPNDARPQMALNSLRISHVNRSGLFQTSRLSSTTLGRKFMDWMIEFSPSRKGSCALGDGGGVSLPFLFFRLRPSVNLDVKFLKFRVSDEGCRTNRGVCLPVSSSEHCESSIFSRLTRSPT